MRAELWPPKASIAHLKQRALILAQIRNFFAERGVLEVDTPLLSQGVATDCHLDAFKIQTAQGPYYLQTSPEYGMKRLLAAGMGSIYQLGKAFRREEAGRWHNPEFCLLEWYHLGFDHWALMREVAELLETLGLRHELSYFDYQTLFETFLDLNPFAHDASSLAAWAGKRGLRLTSEHNWDDWTQLILTHFIEPQLRDLGAVFIYHFPKSQAALAQVVNDRAERFELYYKGLELANGYHELRDATEQENRFAQDLKLRAQSGREALPVDTRLLSALEQGLPACAGVALGFDRLLAILLETDNLAAVTHFDWERA